MKLVEQRPADSAPLRLRSNGEQQQFGFVGDVR